MNCSSSRVIRAALVSLLFSFAVAAFAQHAAEPHPDPIKNVFWQPDQPQQGSPLFVTCELTAPAIKVTGTWHGKRLTFFRGEKPHLWYALAGVDLDTQPGPYEVKVSAHLRTGRWASATKRVTIEPINASAGNVQVPEQYVQPSPEEQKQIAHDDLLKKRAFARDIQRPLWSGGFAEPIEAPATPSFGETRLMNEEKTSRHLGTDYPAKEGTAVHASNSGVVVLARSMFYEGNIVIINHGQRLFTVYMHLSRIDVHEGRRVRKGQTMGLSGATGRVSGPHLHFEAKWSGSAVDPVQLVHLTLPDLKPEHRHAH
ncbi:M23 family metallopeptidase [Occallatibacter riparius]|uniref:M23 family metallopeptidase n=1 Tax=Occallatibacter riparius TaxID=1002689 RepID=A0A9J7BKH9_9BACT|nr:M23 family metallopeptidase [Occallatibacter riparius]UWZ81773.1 M23 family metallopeptidase [Occallatibacter riparius]